jgi:hypothetical protein
MVIENIIYTLITYRKFATSTSDFPFVGMSLGANIGVAIVICLLTAATFFSTTKANISHKLRLPINREILAAGNLINIISSTVILLIMVMTVILIEEIFGRVLSLSYSDVILIHEMNVVNFITRLWVTASYVILIASLAYCLGIFLFRYTISVSIILVIMISLLSLFPSSVRWMFNESSIQIFSIKVWLIIIFMHIISYFPLRKVEVNL